MALFSSTAWMMKGGGSSAGALDSMPSDDSPYKKGKTTVNLVLGSPTLTISEKNTKFVLTFKVMEVGFTEDPANVSFRIELLADGHWRYTSTLDTVNLSRLGVTVSVNLSNKINGNSQLRTYVLSTPKAYLLFETGTQICKDQIKCSKIVT